MPPAQAGNMAMTQLHPKYIGSWKIFQSPFDHALAFGEDDERADQLRIEWKHERRRHEIADCSWTRYKAHRALSYLLPRRIRAVLSNSAVWPGANVTVYKAGVRFGWNAQVSSANESMLCLRIGIRKRCLGAIFINDTNNSNDPSAQFAMGSVPNYRN